MLVNMDPRLVCVCVPTIIKLRAAFQRILYCDFFQQPTQAQWRKVFYIAGGIYIFCATFYNLFGSGRRQEWDNPANDEANAKKVADKKAVKKELKAAKNQNQAETAQ